MDKNVIKEVIEDAIKEANTMAEQAFEEALNEYDNYRGENYENEIYDLLPYTDENGLLVDYGSGFPFNVGEDFAIPFMNGKWEQKNLSEEDRKAIDDYNNTFSGGELRIDAMRVATAMRFYKVLETIKHPYTEYSSDDYWNFIDQIKYDINYNRDNPEKLADNKLYILRQVLKEETYSYYMLMKNNMASLINYEQIILDKIKNDSRLNGEELDINIEDIISKGAEYAAIKAIINKIKPEEFDKDMMKTLYEHNYQGDFNNPIIAQMYQDYVKEEDAHRKLESDNKMLKKQLDQKEEEKISTQTQLDNEKKKNTENKTIIETLKSDKRVVENQLKQKEQEVSSTQTQLEQMQQEYEAKIRSLTEQLEQTKLENNGIRTRLDRELAKKEQSDTKLAEQQRKSDSIIDDKQSKIAGLREIIQKLSTENEQLKERNEALNGEKISLQQKLEPLLKFVERVKNSIVGKLFFSKEMKSLPQGTETKFETPSGSDTKSSTFKENIKYNTEQSQWQGKVYKSVEEFIEDFNTNNKNTSDKNEHEQ